MVNSPLSISVFDVASVIMSVMILGLSLYAAWFNLVRKHISKFGFDAFLLVIGGYVDKKQTNTLCKSPKLIRRMGLMMLMFAIGSVFALIEKLLEIL